MNKFVWLLAIIVGFSSCNSAEKQAKLDKITQLEKSVDSIETVLNKNVIDTIAGLKNATSQVELRIKAHLKISKVDMVLDQKMNRFKLMRKSLNPLGRNFNKIRRGILEEKTALSALKKDIENGAGNAEKQDEFIAFEKNKVEQINVLLTDYMETKEKFFVNYKELYPELLAFSLDLEAKDKSLK